MRVTLFALALAAAAPAPVERKAVLNALRPAVEAKLGSDVQFVVHVIRVEDGWAFVMADPQRKGGKPIDGRRVFGEDFDNMDGLRVDAVLQRKNGYSGAYHPTHRSDHLSSRTLGNCPSFARQAHLHLRLTASTRW